jgi:UDP-GlcNAc:undecaprenyl-phosphate/decaprenyl-phosphate GlcNAc-1-phosphate transferase
MGYLLICPVLAFVTTIIAIKGTMIAAERANVYDRPGPLKTHAKPISRLGGAGIMAGLLVALSPWLLAYGRSFMSALLLLSAIWALGLADDLWGLSSIFRLCIQVSVGAGLWLAGWRLEFTSFRLVDLLVTAFLFAFFVNSMNLLDGMDGLATGTAAIASLGFVLFSPKNSSAEVLAACLLGACLGALIYNLPPARTFIGDSGSTLLGALLFFLTLGLSHSTASAHRSQLGFLLLAVPLADSLFAIIRRTRSGASPFAGDRFHYYDILRARGLSVPAVLCVSYGLGAAMLLLALLCVRGLLKITETGVVVVLLLVSAGFLIGSFSTPRVKSSSRAPVPAWSENPSGEL